MEKYSSENGMSVLAHKGDAMTLLAFDLEESRKENLAGFTIKITVTGRPSYFIYNRMKLRDAIVLPDQPEKESQYFSSLYAPIQKFRWIHVPSTMHYWNDPYFGDYTYEVYPRYFQDSKLLALDETLKATVTIDVSPFTDEKCEVNFTRSFISSQAFAHHFGNQIKLRPKVKTLNFDIKETAGSTIKLDQNHREYEREFTYEEIHKYLGWQARKKIKDTLDLVLGDKNLCLDVFAYDLNEPYIVKSLLTLASEGRTKIILDDYPNHSGPEDYETLFENEFNSIAQNSGDLFRGHYRSQAHSKLLIVRENTPDRKAVKVLTGSANFTTNGLYINANHLITFNDPAAAQLYADVFDNSFGADKMDNFADSVYAGTDYDFSASDPVDMTIRFSPHTRAYTDILFDKISNRIADAESDVLFAVMIDNSRSSILDALHTHLASDKIFTFGITDENEDIQLYKPNSTQGVKISALDIETQLPKPFSEIARQPGLGHVIHHKFIVVDFKGNNPVVYCGSSNLAFNPEQKNGDNLIEIRDREIVTVFAIEAIRLIDHFHWINKKAQPAAGNADRELFLHDNSTSYKWYEKYYNSADLRCKERELLIKKTAISADL
ncbi:phospholipase D-like domain-containing protein [Flavobacterium sp. DGU38]|uniref:phospholipase D n=1 Tax=Flavobacterium calami TaxID=3139144 RepID=A0ABU9INT6_9FLAO